MKNLLWNFLHSALVGHHYLHDHYFSQDKLLDLGCGNGHQFLSKKPSKSVGIDTNFKALFQAKTTGFQVALASARTLPFQANTFQAINCNNLIEHLTPPQAHSMLRESARVLKPNGHLVLHTQTAHHGIWNTFSHIRPYPPQSIFKLLNNTTNRETYDSLTKLQPIAIYYEGKFFSNKLLFFTSTLLANVLPIFRRDYTLVLQKTTKP